ncbi:MAG: heparinase II/III family protein [Alphaproteobacteria bacterium]|nr:MAG: heparinase II/III family protein [Alphaproteobacteria bacterium]
MAIADQPRVIGLALAGGWRRARSLLGLFPGRLRIGGPAPDRLVLAPPDLHTADPIVAQDIYAGVFHLAGHTASATGDSPFRIQAPHPRWEHELHSFAWLCHLAAAGDALSAQNAQALVSDWLDLHARPDASPAWRVETAARRLIAWLCHSVLIVEDTDFAFYRRFLKSIGHHLRFLRRHAGRATDGLPRLVAEIALAYGSVCVATAAAEPRPSCERLDAELARQILADGGHASRNPACLPELLALLLPLRQSFARLGDAPSPELVSAIDRMLPAMRFFRLGDGGFARFNGVSATPHDLLATLLRYDDTRGMAPDNAGPSGYQRLARGDTIVLVDTGRPPAGDFSMAAHAGCLSFELSTGRSLLVVNCGVPSIPVAEAAAAARATAAHSTVTVNDTSSCRFSVDGLIGRYLDGRILAGPQRVAVERGEDDDGITVVASHDAYQRAFAIVHERALRLSAGGAVLAGTDSFFGDHHTAPRHATRDRVAIRFHLHPGVRAQKALDRRSVILWTGEGRRWMFACDDVEPQLAESIFFAGAGGPRRTVQIVLNARAAEHPRVGWRFERQ